MKSNDIQVEKLKDVCSQAECKALIFDSELYFESSDEWDEATLVLIRSRRLGGAVGQAALAAIAREVAEENPEADFKEGDLENYNPQTRQLFNVIAPAECKVQRCCQNVARQRWLRCVLEDLAEYGPSV